VRHHRLLFVSSGHLLDISGVERPLHELVEPVAVALLEGCSLRLPVVREDDDLVRPRGVAPRSRDAAELLIELAQRLHRVGAFETGVVRDLVVAGEGRVHRRPPAHHVPEDPEHHQVPDHHAHRRAQEGIPAAAVTARTNVAARLTRGGDPLQPDLPGEQRKRPGDVETVGEKRPVPRVRPLLGLHPAHREDRLLGLAREEIAPAGAAVREEPAAVREPSLDRGAIRGR
jgi:hypothetical protein